MVHSWGWDDKEKQELDYVSRESGGGADGEGLLEGFWGATAFWLLTWVVVMQVLALWLLLNSAIMC